MQYSESFYEYFDSEKNKFIILQIFYENEEYFDIYNQLIKYAYQKFLYDGKFHYPLYKNIEIHIPGFINDKKVKIKNINRDIQNNINDFLSKSLKIKNKNIIECFNLYSNIIERDIIITNKYDENENKKKNTFQLYQNKGNGYFSIDIYYTIEEYNYRPSHYTIVMLINRVLTLYSIIISIFIFLIYFTFFY